MRKGILAYAGAFLLAGIYLFVFSESGILDRINHARKRQELSTRIKSLTEENMRLQDILQGYRKGQVPFEEILNSGYVPRGDRLLFLDREQSGPQHTLRPEENETEIINTRIPRIAFLCFCGVCAAAYILWRRKIEEEK